MKEFLQLLEDVISDVGYWSWWAVSENAPVAFQVEFGGVQLWFPPAGEGKAPSGKIALRFRKPRVISFLSMTEDIDPDWSEKLQRDEIEPFNVRHDAFTLTSRDVYGQILSRAVGVRKFLGLTDNTPPADHEAVLAFDAYSVGLIVIAESMAVVAHHGELDQPEVLSANQKWWEYWKEYWRRRSTDAPMPKDYACEVTIPLEQFKGVG